MKRIAYASPVNPAPSGISDYSEELLPYLAQFAAITLYLDDALRPSNPQLARHLDVRPLGRLHADQQRQPFDAVLYHMGNSPAHAAIWQAMQRVPGVVVLHDWVLHHFMLQIAAADNSIASYLAEARDRYGADGERVAQLMGRGRFTAAAFALPFNERVLDCAQGLIAHSHYVIERAAVSHPNLPAARVPMGVPLPPLIARDVARARLGLPLNALILASCGHINPFKRVEAVLRTLPTLRAEFGDVRYVLVGSVSANYDVAALVQWAGLADAVQITGYVARNDFEDYVAAADICLNLRHPTAGETSASLLRLLGAGRPTLVTASGSFTELPPGVAAQVDPDRSEGDLILAYCRLLASRPDIAAAMGREARAHVARHHTLDGAAADTIRFLAQLHGWGDMPPLRAPLWTLSDDRRQTKDDGEGEEERRRGGEEERRSESSMLKYHLQSADNPPSSIVHRPLIAAALAGIGATEDDMALLRAVAQALVELRDEQHR